MKLRAVEFDDEENPSELTVTMSLDEMALLYRFAGHISPAALARAFGSGRWSEAHEGLVEAGGILNMFFESGPDEVIPKFNLYTQPNEAEKQKECLT